MVNVGLFHSRSVNFEVYWYMKRPFGIFCGRLVYFYNFVGTFHQGKSGNPVSENAHKCDHFRIWLLPLDHKN
jgi:hypothetical protein